MRAGTWLAGLLSLGLALAAGARAEDAITVEAAILEASEHNPELLALRREAAAAVERIRPAGALADPEVELATSDLGMEETPWRAELMVRQMFDWPGRRGLMRQQMGSMAASQARQLRERELDLEASLREAYWDLSLLREHRARTLETRKLLADFAGIAQSRYSLGVGLQQDILRAESEIYKLEAQQIGFEQQERTLLLRINVLMGRPPEQPLQIVPPEMGLPEPPLDPNGLVELAFASRPMLHAMALEVQALETKEALARKANWPNLEASLGIMHASSSEIRGEHGGIYLNIPMAADTAFSASVMATIPLWKGSKQSRLLAEARLEVESMRARLESTRNQVAVEIRSNFQEAEAFRRRLKLYGEEILPRARQAVSLAAESYQAGQSDFLTLLSSEENALESQLQYHRLHTEYLKSLVRLRRAVGAPLDSTPASNPNPGATP